MIKTVKVKSVKRIPSTEFVVDISVEGNHNLFVCDKITDLPVLAHNCSMDVQSIIGIYKEQIKRSSMLTFGKANYKPYFVNNMLYQMSETAHQISHLRQDGSYIDIDYLVHLRSKNSPLLSVFEELERELRSYPEVKAANKILLERSGIKTGGLFSDRESWVIGFGKQAHKEVLFFEEMRLEPVNFTEKGSPGTGKLFQAAYKDDYPVVNSFHRLRKGVHLYGAFVNGWYKKVKESIDSVLDHHLRADYSFIKVVTGRLSSEKPSLQQIPARGEFSKHIKRLFIAPLGCLLIKFDYSAHEVRIWAIIANDKVLADTFRVGQKLRQEYISDPTPERKKDIAQKGDLHIINVKFFFNMVVDKSHPIREAIKAVIFGVIYGKAAPTLGKDIRGKDLTGALDKERTARRAIEKIGQPKTKEEKAQLISLQKEHKAAEKEIKAIQKKDYDSFASGLMEKLFERFQKGAQWLEWAKEKVMRDYYVYHPAGRRRNLPGVITGIKSVVSAMKRRAMNSPIQGWASEIGVKSSREVMKSHYSSLDSMVDLGLQLHEDNNGRIRFNRIVHDALYFSVPYECVLPFIHILQYESTYGVTKKYKEEFGIDFLIEPEIEIEVSGREDSAYKWDWAMPNLLDAIARSILDLQSIGKLRGTPDEVLLTIFDAWKNTELRAYLQKNYPLLGVHKLDHQIDPLVKIVYSKKLRSELWARIQEKK